MRERGAIDFRERFPALDGLRGLAVTLVFLEHYAGGAHGGRVLTFANAVRLRGWVGVDLFLVLSGFLITGVLYDTRTDPGYFRKFFARRSLRIFPVFYGVAAVLLLMTPLVHYAWQWGQLWLLVYLGNFAGNWHGSLYGATAEGHPMFSVTLSHFWSLCVEEQFYWVWPVVVWGVRDRVRLLWVAGCLCVVALGLRAGFFFWVGPVVAERWIMRTLPFRMDALLAGAVLALLLRGPRAAAWLRGSEAVFWMGAVGALAVFALSPVYDSGWLLTVGLTAIAGSMAGLIGMTVEGGGWAGWVFGLRGLRALGRYSYGFYVYHLLFRAAWIQLLIWLQARTHSLALAGVVALGLNFAVTFAVAKVSFDWYEVRFLRWKRRFAYCKASVAKVRQA